MRLPIIHTNPLHSKGPGLSMSLTSFLQIFQTYPEGSEKDGVLASILQAPDAANKAMIDAEIPQTAKVDRKTATVKVEYDGAPKFSPIEGTSLQLAENSNLTVFKESTGKYFALDNGVWFTDYIKGPSSVATERPKR